MPTAPKASTPATRTARQLQGDRSRKEILNAASALMSARGYSGTSMSELAKRAGLPVASIYWHFESKAGVLAAVMERGARLFFASMSAGSPPDSAEPRERLLAMMQHSHDTVQAHPEFLRLFMYLLLTDAGGGREQSDVARDVVARVRFEGRRHLAMGLEYAYAPWGQATAQAIAEEFADLLLSLFDGSFIAGQAGTSEEGLVAQSVDAVHASISKRHGPGDG